MKHTKMKNITELRNTLLEKLGDLESGALRVPIAKEFFNGAGKVINSVKIQLDYCALRKDVPNIEFMNENA